MSDQIAVSRSDVQRAQLVVQLNNSLGRNTDPAIRKIAAAAPADQNGSSSTNGR